MGVIMSIKVVTKRRRYNRSGYYWEKQNDKGVWVRDESAKPRRLSRFNFVKAWLKCAAEGKELHHFTKRYSWSRQKAQMQKNATNKWLSKHNIKAQLPDLEIGSVLRNGNADLNDFKELFALFK